MTLSPHRFPFNISALFWGHSAPAHAPTFLFRGNVFPALTSTLDPQVPSYDFNHYQHSAILGLTILSPALQPDPLYYYYYDFFTVFFLQGIIYTHHNAQILVYYIEKWVPHVTHTDIKR